MRTFRKSEVISLSGLSGGQIDQLISRHGFPIWAEAASGHPREFLPADVFSLMIAGELSRLGLDQAAIRLAEASFPAHRLKADGKPARFSPLPNANYWIFLPDKNGEIEFVASAVSGDELGRLLPALTAQRSCAGQIVINVGAIGERLSAAAQASSD